MSRNVKPQNNTIFSYYIQQNGDGNFEITRMRIGTTAIDSLFGGLCDNCPDEKKECAKCSFF